MKIYLAGPCDTEHRSIMMCVANIMRNHGMEVYCPWELKIDNAWDYPQEKWSEMVFDKDIEAIDDCNVMIVISTGRDSTAGTNWEQGYAYAIGKTILVLQITNASTSVMTFCGCDYFHNTNFTPDKLGYFMIDVENLLDIIKHHKMETKKCSTILT